jgi:predicted Zn-dependent protease
VGQNSIALRAVTALFLVSCGSHPPGPSRAIKPTAAAPTGFVPTGPPARLDVIQPARGGGVKPEPIVELMTGELTRSLAELTKRGEAPYFASYQAGDARSVSITASFGALEGSTDSRRRWVDVDVRAGDFTFDSTHRTGGRRGRGGTVTAPLPLVDDPLAVRTALWLATDSAVKQATEQLSKAQANKKVTVGDDDNSDDFSHETASEYFDAPASLTVDRPSWEKRLRALSATFRSHPEILSSSVSLTAMAETDYYVNSEGTRYQIPAVHFRITVSASTRADDGMDLRRTESFDSASGERLATDEQIAAKIDMVIADLNRLRTAPVVDPYSGPAILEGKAAGVFFHEVFGHRIEGHRQKNEADGQTFSKKVGQAITASFIDVYDDPSIATLNGTDLNGFYRYDDEGIAGQKASLVEHGVLKTFLMARSPIRDVAKSNGHGRRQAGRAVVSRQGNLIVAPQATIGRAALQAMLLDEVKRQNKPYGLIFKELDGGFTMTERFSPQAFKLLPVMVYRVYPDGHEELVRGADLEGTPLAALGDIRAAADDVATFNGFCGAESGYVPVSATSPSLLVGRVEVTKKAKGNSKAPVLPAPPLAPEGTK